MYGVSLANASIPGIQSRPTITRLFQARLVYKKFNHNKLGGRCQCRKVNVIDVLQSKNVSLPGHVALRRLLLLTLQFVTTQISQDVMDIFTRGSLPEPRSLPTLVGSSRKRCIYKYECRSSSQDWPIPWAWENSRLWTTNPWSTLYNINCIFFFLDRHL